jgi:uncharacterized protein (DUF2267 family)
LVVGVVETTMQHEEFLDRVRANSGVTDRTAATRLVEATLETLGERIGGDEARQLAAQLPGGLKETMSDEPAERFGVDEFRDRVRERSGLGNRVGNDELAAVFEVLSAAVSGGELDDVRGRLPDDYDRFFPE